LPYYGDYGKRKELMATIKPEIVTTFWRVLRPLFSDEYYNDGFYEFHTELYNAVQHYYPDLYIEFDMAQVTRKSINLFWKSTGKPMIIADYKYESTFDSRRVNIKICDEQGV
jgi:hypothetical protein